MLQSLFRRAEASVDNAIAVALTRALVALPFLIAAGFATAGLATYLYREFGSETGNIVMAGVFIVIGAITAGIVASRSKAPEAASVSPTDTAERTAANGDSEAPLLDPMDREVVAATLAAVGPMAIPFVVRAVMRNLPLVAAIAAAGFILSRQGGGSSESPMQPAE
jgi:hypothetical protein